MSVQQLWEKVVKIFNFPRKSKLIPFAFECKNQEKLNIWESLKQAESNSQKGKPVLVFKRNRSKTYAVLEIQDFIDLIK